MSALCQLCGRPVFEGVAGYVGPQCRCLWVRLPKMQDAINAGDGTLHGAIDYWQGKCAELEAKIRVTEEALKLSEAVLAATQEVYGACLGPKTHEGIEAALAKIKEAS